MTWPEAHELLRRGLLVRRSIWIAGRFLYLPSPGIYMLGAPGYLALVQAEQFGVLDYDAEDWELFGTVQPGMRIPTLVHWRALGPYDDDVALMVDGEWISDTGLNVTWYFGEQIIFPGSTNPYPAFLTAGFRELRLTAADFAFFDIPLASGLRVEVFGMDGYGPDYIVSPWEATITYSDGSLETLIGGDSRTGSSVSGPSGPDYYTLPRHFATYIANGDFVIP